MGEFLTFFIVLAIVLAIIAVLGHGLWLAAAWLLGLLTGHRPASEHKPPRQCPQCGSSMKSGGPGCAACGWPAEQTREKRQANLLRSVAREVDRYGKAELIDAACLARLNALLLEEQARLRPPAADIVAAELVTAETVEPQPAAYALAASAPSVAAEPLDPAARARHYMARQAELAGLPAPLPQAALRKPARAWSEIFKAFLEEKNIRWGELIGGLLIVCCSIALVISFWSAIAERPFLKFFVFNGVTAGLFGVGFYAQHRLKLPHTGQGLLLIASLLVPLNFLAIAAFSRGPASTEPLIIGGELISIGIFTSLVYFAGKAVTAPWPSALVFGVMGTSIAQLLVRRFVDPGDGAAELYAIGALPLACFLGSVAWALVRWPRGDDATSSHALFRFLGLVAFAVLLPVGLLLAKSGQPVDTLRLLAPLVSLAGVPLLAAGLFLARRTESPALAALRTAATAIAALGAFIWLAGTALAWPDPARMLAIAAIGSVLFTVIALRSAIAPAHLLAAANLALAVLLGVHVFRGELAWQETDPARVMRALTSAASGAALIPVSFLLTIASAMALRWRRAPDTLYLAAAAGGLSAISLALVAWHAIEAGTAVALAAPLFGIAAVWLALSWLMRWPKLFTACQALLSVAVAVAVTARLESEVWFQQAARPWLDPWTLQAQAVALAVLAIIWTGLRIAVTRWGERAPSLVTLRSLLNPPWPAFDRVMNVVLLVTLIGLTLYGAAPGVAQELTPRRLASELSGEPVGATLRVVPPLAAFQWQGIPHEHALGYGSWLLGGLLISVFFAGQWERYNPWRMYGVVTVLAMACPLLASFWTPEVAAASALRWIAAGFLLVGSAVIWCREPLARLTARLGWPGWGDHPAGLSRDCRTLLLTVVVLLLAAMGAYVALAAVMPGPIDASVGSTFPWLAVTFVVLAVIAISLRMTPFGIFPDASVQRLWQTWSRQVSLLLLILGAAPLVAVSLFVVTMALRGNPIAGPEPTSIFTRMGLAASYAVPIVLIALALVGHALRERSAGFAFTAGLLFNTAATAGFLLALRSAQLDATLWVRLAQLNALVSAVYALAWLAVLRWGPKEGRTAPALLVTQVMLPIALTLLILLPSGVTLWWNAAPGAANVAAGQWMGWLSFAVTLAAGAWLARSSGQRLSGAGTWAGLAAVATLTSLAVSPWDTTGNWLAFHTLLVGHVAVGGLLLALASIVTPLDPASLVIRRNVARWCTLAALISGAIALRGAFQDPHGPWWSIGALVAVAVLLACAASWASQQRFLYLAGLALNLAASVWFIERWWPTGPNRFAIGLIELVEINALVLALPVIAWILIELWLIRPALAESLRSRGLPMHATAAFLAMLLLGATVALGLLGDAWGEPLVLREWLGWTAVAAAAVAMLACLWDASLRLPMFGLYLLGLVAIGMTVDHFNLQQPRWLAWTGAMIAAAYALGTSYLWSRREGLRRFADAVGIPRGPDMPVAGLRWLVPANGLLIATVLAAAYWVDLTFPEQGLRLLTAKAALFQTLSMGLLARGAKRSVLQTASLLVGVIAAVAWGWAWLEPATTGTLLNRAVVVTASLAAMIVLYGLGLAKLLPAASEWTAAARRLVPTLIGLAAVSMAFILTMEVVLWLSRGEVLMAPLAIFVVAAALIGLAVAAIAAAVLPGRDPLGLSERGRTLYVYGAEILLALLIMHIRLTMPWLFHGFFSRYWTFIVVFVAFLGVGFSEFFARRRQTVLSEPLERTGAFLPLLPVLGFWVAPAGHYSLLLFSVGAVYATLAVMRKSFGFGILATIAANGGLWYFLHRAQGYGLLEHPQLWCIPPAVCVLVAAWLNRDRLSVEQMTGIRYLTSMTIYVSSTADIFLNGVAEAPWLPLVLAAISLAGIFAGILLRVRAFLFLGTSFLMLSLLTMIWHAAHNLEQTWVWSASGIVTGILIIALFALFEKKRQEVLHLVDQLKEWE